MAFFDFYNVAADTNSADKLQKLLTADMEAAAYKALYEISNQEERAWLVGCSQRNAAAWLRVIPSTAALVLSRIHVRSRPARVASLAVGREHTRGMPHVPVPHDSGSLPQVLHAERQQRHQAS